MKLKQLAASSFSTFWGLALSVFTLICLTSQSHAASGRESFVRFKAGTSVERQAEILSSSGQHEIWRSKLVVGLVAVEPTQKGADPTTIEAQRDQLSARTEVLYAEPNYTQRRDLNLEGKRLEGKDEGLKAPNDPYLANQWALTGAEGIRPDSAWEALARAQTPTLIKVGVIDTGIDPTHPDLAAKVLPGFDFIDNSSTIKDVGGHGSHVSGIIAASSNNGIGISGVAPTAMIIPARAVPAQGDETDLNVMKAFEFVVSQGARVANCSFGKKESSQAVSDVISAAGEKGLLVVVAAGNDSSDNNSRSAFPVNFRTPNMIGVASTNSRGAMSYFSNYGMGFVDLGAPGSRILSTMPGNVYQNLDGTSMASPQVAGVAALVLSVVPQLTVSQLKQALLSSVRTTTALQGRVTTGGVVDASAAVAAAQRMVQ